MQRYVNLNPPLGLPCDYTLLRVTTNMVTPHVQTAFCHEPTSIPRCHAFHSLLARTHVVYNDKRADLLLKKIGGQIDP